MAKSRLKCASLALALAVWLGCALPPPPPDVPQYFEARPELVLEAAVSILSRDGYVLSPVDPNYNLLTGQQERTLGRSEEGLLPGTRIMTQIVVEANASGPGTQVLATFSIRSRRPTGESRTWVPESPFGQRLRGRFYADLSQELGLDGSAASEPSASH